MKLKVCSHLLISSFAFLLIAGCTNTAEDTHFIKKVHVTNDEERESNGGAHELNGNGDEGEAVPTEISGYSTDAKQRFVWLPKRLIVEPVMGADGKTIKKRVTERTIICAEPSPDALSSMAANFSASGSGRTRRGDVSGNMMKSFTESVQEIGVRTVSIQLLRDTLYRACEGYANGVIDKFGYSLILSQMDNLMKEMMAITALERGGVTGKGVDANGQVSFEEAEADVKSLREDLARKKSMINDLEMKNIAYEAAISAASENVRRLQAEIGRLEKDKQDGKQIDEVYLSDLQIRIEDEKSQKEKANKLMESTTKHLNSLNGEQGIKGSVEETEEKLRKARTKLAGAVRSPLEVEAVTAIQNITKTNNTSRNLASACMMWLAENPQIKMRDIVEGRYSGETPAIAGLCAKAIMKLK